MKKIKYYIKDVAITGTLYFLILSLLDGNFEDLNGRIIQSILFAIFLSAVNVAHISYILEDNGLTWSQYDFKPNRSEYISSPYSIPEMVKIIQQSSIRIINIESTNDTINIKTKWNYNTISGRSSRIIISQQRVDESPLETKTLIEVMPGSKWPRRNFGENLTMLKRIKKLIS